MSLLPTCEGTTHARTHTGGGFAGCSGGDVMLARVLKQISNVKIVSWVTAFTDDPLWTWPWTLMFPQQRPSLLLCPSLFKQSAFRSHLSATRCQFVCFSVLMGLIFFFSCLFLYVMFFFLYCEYQEMTFIFYQRCGFGLFFLVLFCFVQWPIRTLTSELVKKF